MKLVDEFFTHFYEMARKIFSHFEIFVYGDEGEIPHFHFIDYNNENESCICLLDNQYFSHSGKNLTLCHKDRKLLMEYLSLKGSFTEGTKYRVLCKLWNLKNPNRPQIDEEYIMPDYTKIKRYKEDDDFLIVGNLKNVRLTIHANEANKKPHMHFVNLKTGEKGALSLQKAEYFDHDEYNGRLSNELLKEVYDYCNSKTPITSKAKNFDFICITWAKVNKNCQMSKNTPRYDLINKR